MNRPRRMGEKFAEYRLDMAREARDIRDRLKGEFIWVSTSIPPVRGKGMTFRRDGKVRAPVTRI